MNAPNLSISDSMGDLEVSVSNTAYDITSGLEAMDTIDIISEMKFKEELVDHSEEENDKNNINSVNIHSMNNKNSYINKYVYPSFILTFAFYLYCYIINTC